MIKTLTHIDVKSFARIYMFFPGTVYSIMSIFAGISQIFAQNILIGVSIIILGPVISFALGYLIGMFVPWILNFIIKKMGGIKIDLK